jgi:hypothetical protein
VVQGSSTLLVQCSPTLLVQGSSTPLIQKSLNKYQTRLIFSESIYLTLEKVEVGIASNYAFEMQIKEVQRRLYC